MGRLFSPFSLALGALATTALGGCYYGDMTSAGYGGNYACAADYYDYDPYAYDDGYGYDCYDSSDYGSGFVSIGFGGGWYDDYYYPGYGMWMYDHYRNRYPLSGRYLGYWGGRSEEHTSELQSLMRISYAVFCLKKKKNNTTTTTVHQN